MWIKAVLREATLAFDKPYSYRWPERLGEARIGLRVALPFGRGNRLTEAYVWSVYAEEGEAQRGLKAVAELLYPEPVLDVEQLELAEMMRLRYACTYGEAIRGMLPPGFNLKGGLKDRSERTAVVPDYARAVEMLENAELRSVKQERVLEFLLENGESGLAEVEQNCQVGASVLRRLRDRGLIAFNRRAALPEAAEEEVPGAAEEAPEAVEEQAEVLERLGKALLNPGGDARRLKEYLLHGVTGSGKTEVYLQLARRVLEHGRSCLILVPEIALTPQMRERFARRFPGAVGVMHSRLTQRERFELWKRLRRGELRLLLGARSAVFMPLKDLALIVVDEEHESSYQSEMSPRYHARTVARLRARDRDCVLLLASATPALESYARCAAQKSVLLEMKRRATGAAYPSVSVVDMRREQAEGHGALLSRPLLGAMERCLERGEQMMLFLNRRGFAGLYLCRDCGYKISCPHCSLSLTYHRAKAQGRARLICHGCGYMEPAPRLCPACGSARIQAFGLGTQQVEESVARCFPGVKALRMDLDSTRGRRSHQDILDQFRSGEAQILIGTQMIAKGHDFPRVTLVAVLACEQLLNGIDYRANERGFQLIVQAAGRAGRSELPGRVILQSFDPENPTLLAAARMDYRAFYAEEMLFRKALRNPPAGALATILVAATDRDTAEKHAQFLFRLLSRTLRERADLEGLSLYPVRPALPARLYGKTRFQILMRSPDAAALSFMLRRARMQGAPQEVSLSLSLDPA